MSLSPVQKEIIEIPGNLIVRASAGTGKTHTMVNKIVRICVQQAIKEPQNPTKGIGG